MTMIFRMQKVSPAVFLSLLGMVAAATLLVGAPRAAHADHDVACLYLNGTDPACPGIPTGVGQHPICVEFDVCRTPSGASAAINICIGDVADAECPEIEDDLVVDPPGQVTIHQSAAGVVVDAEAGDFPGTTPTGHLLVCINVPNVGVIEAGVADEFGNCEPHE